MVPRPGRPPLPRLSPSSLSPMTLRRPQSPTDSITCRRSLATPHKAYALKHREGTALTVPEKSRKDTGLLAPAVPGTPPVNHRADRRRRLRPVHAPSSFSRVFAFRHSTPAQVGAQSVASRLTLRVAQARLLARKGPGLPVVRHLKLGASELP